MDRLLVAVVGNRNSGKSYTWNTLFNRTVNTGTKERLLPLGNGQCVSVFLVSGSPEERKKYVGKIIQGDPRIVLCSLQYRNEVFDSFQYFLDRGFFAFVHWLNPGYNDPNVARDYLNLIPRLLAVNWLINTSDARGDATERVEEMRDFIRRWALNHDLVRDGWQPRSIGMAQG